MSSRSRAASAFVAALLLGGLSGCDRETRESRGSPLPETAPKRGEDPRAKLYEGNAYHIAQGQRYYAWMNCVGCHAHGGGGMGPPLIDAEWRYGSRMEDIVTTILNGRPNGMPAFKGRITEQQAWELAAYVRALSAQPREDALPSRADEVSNNEPLTTKSREHPFTTNPQADVKD